MYASFLRICTPCLRTVYKRVYKLPELFFFALLVGLGAVLALNHFGAQETLVPAVFATWCVITALVLAKFWAKKA
jgi:hypothetical protein